MSLFAYLLCALHTGSKASCIFSAGVACVSDGKLVANIASGGELITTPAASFSFGDIKPNTAAQCAIVSILCKHTCLRLEMVLKTGAVFDWE